MTGVLDGRRVLVTGASSGMGAAIATGAVAAGARVALVARRAPVADSDPASWRATFEVTVVEYAVVSIRQ